MGATLKSIALLLVSIALWPLTACVVIPVRAPESTKNTLGTKVQLDFSFLKAGTTTRSDVAKNLGAIDTGVNERFFWGRWQSSKWFVVAGTIGAGGGDRVWKVHNILIQFDSNDVVSDWAIIGDNNLDQRLDLLDEPSNFTLELPRALPVNPISHAASQLYSTLFLKEDSIKYTTLDSTLAAPRKNIDKLTSGTLISGTGDPAKFVADTNVELYAKLHFSVPAESRYVTKKQKAKVYKTRILEVILDPADYLLLRRYFRQTIHDSQ
ncbi:MAG TPA: hypothetical protein VGR72_12725 [Candidatus Acidoferrales bacterium]|nr:hypothetical protein [Candidatus Acidoferrales bacterium]HEV2342314.1 hypothetical protein [Candidatus Acidoferrales bacterium]